MYIRWLIFQEVEQYLIENILKMTNENYFNILIKYILFWSTKI